VALALSPVGEADAETITLLSYALRAHAPESAIQLAEALRSSDVAVAVRAARGLKALRELAAPVREGLLQAAYTTEEALVKESLAALGAMGPAARDLLPKIVPFLTYAAPGWRRAAAEVVGEIGFDPAEGDKCGMVEYLLLTLLDTDPDVAWSAYLSLYLLGPVVIPKVKEVLKITEGAAQYWPLRVLARLKADPDEVVPKLIELTQPETQAAERAIAVELLGQYAPESGAAAIPALVRVLGDRTEYVARAARRALVVFGSAAVPALQAALRGRDPNVRGQALAVLDELRGVQ
jgi:hypothetical protein